MRSGCHMNCFIVVAYKPGSAWGQPEGQRKWVAAAGSSWQFACEPVCKICSLDLCSESDLRLSEDNAECVIQLSIAL